MSKLMFEHLQQEKTRLTASARYAALEKSQQKGR
jgi:hypothetical protein